MLTVNELKVQFKSAFQKIIEDGSATQELNESALPAYAHKNPLIDLLFWGRLKACFNLIKSGSGSNILDFGCGTGLFSYLLAHNGHQITAIDLNLNPKRLLDKYILFPEGIKFMEGDLLCLNLQNGVFDYIIALDSLEHIEQIDDYLFLFKTLLKPEGIIIVSGPTENLFYKIGRQLAGSNFNGYYHVSNISKIRKKFSKEFMVTKVKKMYYPIVLFEIFTAHNN